MLSFNFLGKKSKKELFNNISWFFVSSSAQSNRFIYFFNDNIRNASNYIIFKYHRQQYFKEEINNSFSSKIADST